MTTRIPQISGFSRGGVKLVRQGFAISLRLGDKDALLPSSEARELALAILLLTEEVEQRHDLKRIGWTDEKIDQVMRERAEESRK